MNFLTMSLIYKWKIKRFVRRLEEGTVACDNYTLRAGLTFSESIIMKSILFALTIFITLSASAHADCNARKVARHAAMQATVGVSAHCMNEHPVKDSDLHVKNKAHR